MKYLPYGQPGKNEHELTRGALFRELLCNESGICAKNAEIVRRLAWYLEEKGITDPIVSEVADMVLQFSDDLASTVLGLECVRVVF